MKRLLCGCAALVLLTALILPATARAGWSEGLFLQEPNSLQEALLAPNREGVYPLAALVDGNPAPLTDPVLDGDTLTLAVEEGQELLSYARLTQREGVHCLALKTAHVQKVPAAPVRLRISRLRDGEAEAVCRVTFGVGWPTADSSLLQQLEAGEAVPVENTAPAFTREQIEMLMAKNGGSIAFAGEGWRYEVTPSAARDLCLLFSSEPIPAVEQQLGQDGRLLQFFSFPAGAAPGMGQLTLEVPRQAGPLYVYRYAYGRLYRYPAAYDAQNGTLTLSTGVLDRYVVTDVPVAEGTVIGGAGDTSAHHTEKNPDTGDPTRLVPVGIMAGAACGGAVWMVKNHQKTQRKRTK